MSKLTGMRVRGDMLSVAEFGPLDRLRWWAIKLLAGKSLSVMVNIEGDGKGSIWLNRPTRSVLHRVRGVLFLVDQATLHDVYDNNPHMITEEFREQ